MWAPRALMSAWSMYIIITTCQLLNASSALSSVLLKLSFLRLVHCLQLGALQIQMCCLVSKHHRLFCATKNKNKQKTNNKAGILFPHTNLPSHVLAIRCGLGTFRPHLLALLWLTPHLSTSTVTGSESVMTHSPSLDFSCNSQWIITTAHLNITCNSQWTEL